MDACTSHSPAAAILAKYCTSIRSLQYQAEHQAATVQNKGTEVGKAIVQAASEVWLHLPTLLVLLPPPLSGIP